MSRPKGIPKTGGRQKGVPNKTTKEMKEIITKITFEQLDVLMQDFKKLPPNERIKYTIEMAKLVLPKDIAVEEKHQLPPSVQRLYEILGEDCDDLG